MLACSCSYQNPLASAFVRLAFVYAPRETRFLHKTGFLNAPIRMDPSKRR